jgi:hypothetical protein
LLSGEALWGVKTALCGLRGGGEKYLAYHLKRVNDDDPREIYSKLTKANKNA